MRAGGGQRCWRWGPAGVGPVRGRGAPAHPSATPLKHNSLKACTQQADVKKLSGAARTQYVKHCQSESGERARSATPTAAATQATR